MDLLTIILILVLSVMTIALFSIVYFIANQTRKNKSLAGVHFRKGDIEELLSRGNNEAARTAAEKWKSEEPGNTNAYMLLLKAQFRLNEYINAKRTIEELVELAPEFEFTTKNYLSRVNEALGNNRPHAVD